MNNSSSLRHDARTAAQQPYSQPLYRGILPKKRYPNPFAQFPVPFKPFFGTHMHLAACSLLNVIRVQAYLEVRVIVMVGPCFSFVIIAVIITVQHLHPNEII